MAKRSFCGVYSDQEVIDAILYKTTKLINRGIGPSTTVIISKAILIGLDKMLVDSSAKNKDMLADVATDKMLTELDYKEATFKKRAKLLARMGEEAFLEYMEAEKIPEEFMDDFQSWLTFESEGSFNDRAIRWLLTQFSDGVKEIPTNEIKSRATNSGLISESEDEDLGKQWANLRQVGSRHSYSSKKHPGVWRQPEKTHEDDPDWARDS